MKIVLLTGFGRGGYLKSRVKTTGGCADFWRAEKRFRFWIRHVVKAQWFYWFVIVLVFFNTMCVAVEYHGQPDWLTRFLCKYRGSTFFKFYKIKSTRFSNCKNVDEELKPS